MTETRKVVKDTLLTERGPIAALRYRLIEGWSEEETGRRASYAILCEADGEAVFLPDLTSEKARALALYALLVQGEVTPTTIYEVMDELLAGELG